MNGSHGYSGKSLGAKLGLKPGMSVWAVDPPRCYCEMVGPEGAKVMISRDGAAGPFALVHLFVKDRAALEGQVEEVLGRLAPGGVLWISWPKKTSPLFRDLIEDGVRQAVLPTGFVDVKVCAVDADWSGLKFLKRRN